MDSANVMIRKAESDDIPILEELIAESVRVYRFSAACRNDLDHT